MGDVLNSLVKRNAGMLGSLEIEMTYVKYHILQYFSIAEMKSLANFNMK